jgi:putative ABC transport system permease protein
MRGQDTSLLARDLRRLYPDFKHQSLSIYLEEGTDTDAFMHKLQERLPPETVREVINFAKELADSMASYQGTVTAMGLVMLGMTVFVVGLVLYFVINSSIVRKKKALGIQKAVGFTTFQLMNQITLGFLAPIFLGAVTGSLLGACLTNPLMSVMMRRMGMMKAGFIVAPSWVILFIMVTLVSSYLLALLISWRIRKISPYMLIAE